MIEAYQRKYRERDGEETIEEITVEKDTEEKNTRFRIRGLKYPM